MRSTPSSPSTITTSKAVSSAPPKAPGPYSQSVHLSRLLSESEILRVKDLLKRKEEEVLKCAIRCEIFFSIIALFLLTSKISRILCLIVLEQFGR